MRQTGKVIKFEPLRGFGFICVDGPVGEDIFFHITSWPVGEGPPMVWQRVSFTVEDGDAGHGLRTSTCSRRVLGDGPPCVATGRAERRGS